MSSRRQNIPTTLRLARRPCSSCAPSFSSSQLIDANFLGLQTGLLEESSDACTHFVKSHGMLVVLEALRIARSRDVLSILLRIVNLIVGSDPGMLEKIAVR